MPAFQRSSEFGDVVSWFVSKFGAFLSNEMMRNIIGQTKSSFNLREIMDEGKILLVNLSKGRTGDLNSKLLGMIFVMKFQAAAMSRSDMPEEYRKDFCLYVDEFQNFSTDSFADILSEARKYHLNLIVANQFTTQLSEEIRDAVFGNVGTVVSFRVGTNDAEFLAKQFAPVFDIDDLQFIPNYNTVVRMMIGGVPVQPFSMANLPQLGQPNKQLGEALKQLSAAKYGKPKASVDAEIAKRLSTQPALAAGGLGRPGLPSGPTSAFDSFGANRALPPASTNLSSAPPKASGPTASSFLDDWLSKRKGAASGPVNLPPAARPVPASAPQPTQAPKPAPATAPTAPVASENVLAQPTYQPPPPPVVKNSGELKIRRDGSADEPEDSLEDIESVHIDKDGNLSFDH
jgi:TraM recognition site of TraD and TraG